METLSEFGQDMKKVANDLAFIDKTEDLLKETLTVLKKCDQEY